MLIKPAYLGLRELAIRTWVRPGPLPPIPKRIDRLLIIPDQRLGDLCLTMPALQCLREAFTETKMTIILPPSLQPLAQWGCRPDTLVDWNAAATLAAKSWDMVIDLSTDYHLRSALLTRRTAAPVRMGFAIYGKSRFFNLPLATSPSDHMKETYARFLRPLGIPSRQFHVPSALAAKPLQGSSGIRVTIHPGAHHWTQRWPADHFAALIRLIHGGGERCLVVGSEGERELVAEIVRLAGPGAESAISKDVLQLAATFMASEVVICNNSGPLHLASMLGIATLSTMGPTVKERWAPLGDNDVILRKDALPCIGCNRGSCRIRTHACMKEILPEAAFAAYLRLRMAFRDELD